MEVIEQRLGAAYEENMKESKTILVLGAGRGQVGLYKAARELGHRSVAVSIPGDYPGFALADEIDYTDITDKEAVLECARRHKADAVVSACVDIMIPALGYACESLGLCGLSAEAATVCTNKLLMKKAFEKHGVRTARFVEVKPGDDADAVCAHLNYPLIVKAVDLAGSKGINIVMKGESLSEAVSRTMSETRKDYCIVEEYIDGYEFSATSFVADGQILFTLPTGDVRYGENDEIPAGHYLPFDAEQSVLDDTMKQMEGGIRALGLDNCAVNADLMLMDGKVYILEMTGRMGANCMPELTSIYIGYDIYRMIIETALGERGFIPEIAEEKRPCTPCFAQMVVSEQAGTLRSVSIGDDCDADVLMFSKPGDSIRRFASTNDCVGQIITQAATLEEARRKAAEATAKIRLEIE